MYSDDEKKDISSSDRPSVETEDPKETEAKSPDTPREALDDIDFRQQESEPPSDPQSASREEFVDAIYGVPVKVTAVVGAVKMPIEQLVKLGRGAVIQLNKQAGDPVDILVNDRLIARGEVVLLDGTLGITVTELMKEVSF